MKLFLFGCVDVLCVTLLRLGQVNVLSCGALARSSDFEVNGQQFSGHEFRNSKVNFYQHSECRFALSGSIFCIFMVFTCGWLGWFVHLKQA